MSRAELINSLVDLYNEILQAEKAHQNFIDSVHEDNRLSAANLIHYLALRRFDLRLIQDELTDIGISSLGRSESCVLWSLENVLNALGKKVHSPTKHISRKEGAELLLRNTRRLLGEPHPGCQSSIMVTLPTEAAENQKLLVDLLKAGMNVIRINCAHDSPDVWIRMIENSRRLSQELGYSCKIVMDLPGPKLRIVAIDPSVKACFFRPLRDPFGRIIEPAKVWIGKDESMADPILEADLFLKFDKEWIDGLKAGDIVRFFDARGKARTLRVDHVVGRGWLSYSTQTGYLKEGIVFVHLPDSPELSQRATTLKSLSPQQPFLLVKKNDRLWIQGGQSPTKGIKQEGIVGTLWISQPQILLDVKVDEPIWFDDGKIGGRILQCDGDGAVVEITHAPSKGLKLRVDRGINLPVSDLKISAITDQDLKILPFIGQHADAVGISFLRIPSDIDDLEKALNNERIQNLGIILKIETRKAFENLPLILLKAMKNRSVGVMIARGDLAVECGYERLAEVQEEILWISEAAHIPVIWATQVLESLAKTGIPSRAEVTDAAMAQRSECVMLNKGPYIVEAVKSLVDILKRMETHQRKKRSMLRKLHIAGLLNQPL